MTMHYRYGCNTVAVRGSFVTDSDEAGYGKFLSEKT